MPTYKHTQIGYLMIGVTLAVFGVFAKIHLTALAEAPSVDSGPNFLISAVMVLILLTLGSFTFLTTSIDENYLRVKFGYGIFRKKFLLSEIVAVQTVKNCWYYGWGIRICFWPKRMTIYNVSGFEAVEIVLKNGKIYRIGTDVPGELAAALKR